MSLQIDVPTRMQLNAKLLQEGRKAQEVANDLQFGEGVTSSEHHWVQDSMYIGMDKAVYPQDLIQIRGNGLSYVYPAHSGGKDYVLEDASFMIPQGKLVAVS